jgi:hypothetical protein
MLSLRILLFSLLSINATSCNLLHTKDSDAISDAGAGPANSRVFDATGNESSEIKADVVASFINDKPYLLVNSQQTSLFNAFSDLPLSDFSRDGNESALLGCAKNKISKVPLQVTKDTISYSFELDLTKECDREARTTDKIGTVRNFIRASAMIGCSANLTSNLVGKTLGTIGGNPCQNDPSQKIKSEKFAFEFTIDARKVTREKKGTEYEDVLSNVYFRNESLKSNSGLPCNFVTVLSTMQTTFDSCRWVSQERIFENEPKYENNSPNEKTDPHPTVNQKVVTVSNALKEEKANYYTSANSSFSYNGWEGKLTFVHGWTAPSWEAVFHNTKRGGVFGSPVTPIAEDTPTPTPSPTPTPEPNTPEETPTPATPAP